MLSASAKIKGGEIKMTKIKLEIIDSKLKKEKYKFNSLEQLARLLNTKFNITIEEDIDYVKTK